MRTAQGGSDNGEVEETSLVAELREQGKRWGQGTGAGAGEVHMLWPLRTLEFMVGGSHHRLLSKRVLAAAPPLAAQPSGY